MVETVSAREAASHFLNHLEPEKARVERPAVEAFVEWFGSDRSMSELTGDDVTRYTRGVVQDPKTPDHTQLEPLRAFLAYSSRMAFTDTNLVPFLRGSGGARGGAGAERELAGDAYYVTMEGLQSLERELDELKARRPEMAEKLRAAMADKDFRENAPLDAARDEQAHLEARIRDIENRLRRAVIIDEEAKRGRADVGSTVKLLNLQTNGEQIFRLVSPTEVDPANGKISIESPVGTAVKNHAPGDEVEVKAPAGVLRFKLLEVTG